MLEKNEKEHDNKHFQILKIRNEIIDFEMVIELKHETKLIIPILNPFEITVINLGSISIVVEHIKILQKEPAVDEILFDSSELRVKACIF